MSVVADRRLPEREQLLKPHAAEDDRPDSQPRCLRLRWTGVHAASVYRGDCLTGCARPAAAGDRKRAIDSRAVLGATVFASPPLG